MSPLLKRNCHEWNRPYPIWPKDHFKSHELIHEKPFIPSFINRNNKPDMSMLLRFDYSRIYFTEHDNYMNERMMRELKNAPREVRKDMTGLNKKKDMIAEEPQTLFKMSKFKNIPAKVSHRRCIACADKRSKEQN